MAHDEAGLPSGTDLERRVRLRRRLNAPPQRVFRAWADPEELARWLPMQIEGGLAVGARSVLTWADRRVWWQVTRAEPPSRFAFRQPWLPDESLVTDVEVAIRPVGYGTRIELDDGPFRLDAPGAIDAWAEAIELWSDALAMLRAHLDFSVDLRPNR